MNWKRVRVTLLWVFAGPHLPRRASRLLNPAIRAAFALWLSLGCLAAMDRWSALSMIESGDNDRAIGPGGEVSRYQLKPAVWSRLAPADSNPADPRDALAVTQAIMRDRCAVFENRFHRPPTDFEFYVLWNAPAQLIGMNTRAAVSQTVADRAHRFSNLVGIQP